MRRALGLGAECCCFGGAAGEEIVSMRRSPKEFSDLRVGKNKGKLVRRSWMVG